MPPLFSAPPSIHLATLLSLVALAPAAPAAPAWPPALESSLARTAIPRTATAVLVQDVDAATPLLAHRTGEAMNPASVMKLVTTYAALDQLGPTYTWKTRIVTEAPIRNGVLQGDLYVIGGGDPRLSRERLWLLLRELRSRDIRHIEGNVVTDRRFFQLPPHDPGAFDQRPLRPYNAPADALNIDYGALPLRLVPSATGAEVSIDPLPAGLGLDNRIRRAGTGPCNDPSALLTADSREDSNGNSVLTLEGSLPPACPPAFDWNLAPLTPTRLFEGQFRTLWRELGGEIDGRFVNGPAPANARPLAESTSPTLPEVLRDMNKWSNNVIARHLLATLGAESEPGRDSAAAGSRVVERALAAAGIPTDKLVIENGAGLSRSERVSADTLGRLLMAAWRSRSMPELIASLPIAGRDGTARRRVANSPAAGSAHIKTGTLDGVRSLAGYVQGASGHRYIVVLLINHPNAGAGREVQDALLEWVAGL